MDFVIIANAWSAALDNPTSKHQVALELARQGHRVLWVEGAGMRKPSLASGDDRSRIMSKLRLALGSIRTVVKDDKGNGSISILTPLLIPFPSSSWIRAFNGWLCAKLAARWSTRLGFRDPVLINYVPVLVDAMRFWRQQQRSKVRSNVGDSAICNSFVIYHCVDRWDAFGMYDTALMAGLDEACCREADIVIASSKDLYERCIKFNHETRLMSHGVDYRHFSTALDAEYRDRPADLPKGRIAGFVGLISEWVDQDLLVKLARELPDCNVVLVGKADVPVDKLKGLSNIHLLGSKPFASLPGYLAGFDVGLIPFVVNDLTRAVNPIKLREMLAAGCPVISTDLPEVAMLCGGAKGCDQDVPGIALGKSDSEFIGQVKARLECPLTSVQRQAISKGMKDETWATRVRLIMSLVAR